MKLKGWSDKENKPPPAEDFVHLRPTLPKSLIRRRRVVSSLFETCVEPSERNFVSEFQYTLLHTSMRRRTGYSGNIHSSQHTLWREILTAIDSSICSINISHIGETCRSVFFRDAAVSFDVHRAQTLKRTNNQFAALDLHWRHAQLRFEL